MKVDELERELTKSQKTLNRSKRAREVETLLQENESLQRKLQSQEDEFRLQNTTLVQELSTLISTNAALEKELKAANIENSDGNKENISSDLENEIRHLQAENAALLKSLAESRKQYETEIISSKATRNCDGDIKVADPLTSENYENIVALKEQLKQFTDLKLKLDIEEEEKKMLASQIDEMKKTHKQEISNLQEEIHKLTDKLRRKQESIVQLQQEKEQLYTETKKSYETLQSSKDHDIQQLNEQIQRLQTQLSNSLQIQQEQKQKSSLTIQQLEESISLLKSQISEHSNEIVKQLQEEKQAMESDLLATKMLLEDSQKEVQLLSCQLEESQNQSQQLENDLKQMTIEKKSAEYTVAEATKVAEKRKALLDEMAVHLQETSDQLTEEIVKQREQYLSQIDDLKKELELEKEKSSKLDYYKSLVKDLELKLETAEDKKTILEQKLTQLEKSLDDAKSHHQATLNKSVQEHNEKLSKLSTEMEAALKDLTSQLDVTTAQKSELEEEVIRLKQDAKDVIEERKIQEKKGLSMVKELKRQLQVERRRAEKLQERLQELLNESPQSRCDDILQSVELSDKQKGDTSSISSWSLMSGGNLDSSKESAAASEMPNHTSERNTPVHLEQETSNLLERVAILQEEKWTLEEKINHLEMSNAAMAEDLMKKTSIIQYYCMEGRGGEPNSHLISHDKLTVRRVMDFIKDKGDENLRERNRRMQRMLEETLTKNMHLQKDLEFLSNEVSRLNKINEEPEELMISMGPTT
ncbi:GRIP1-associated protein 1-like [Centruroides sculpturatus]|uniref:GRIP1-associated protein 1-like n=1 Tax=Centruroides sculpturatus TaxID=218467 RepID=UPI000C6DA519|nr:GRIP1-associated protein 1-like [Centruroides sculpturatus]